MVGIVPGFTRTEAVVDAFAAEGMNPPEIAHSPEYVGRAVAHVAIDLDVMSLSGKSVQAATLADRYGFSFRMADENCLALADGGEHDQRR